MIKLTFLLALCLLIGCNKNNSNDSKSEFVESQNTSSNSDKAYLLWSDPNSEFNFLHVEVQEKEPPYINFERGLVSFEVSSEIISEVKNWYTEDILFNGSNKNHFIYITKEYFDRDLSNYKLFLINKFKEYEWDLENSFYIQNNSLKFVSLEGTDGRLKIFAWGTVNNNIAYTIICGGIIEDMSNGDCHHTFRTFRVLN